MKAAGQHVDEEAADELAGGQHHGLMPGSALGTMVFPLKGNLALIAGDESAAGGGHAVRVARQIGQHDLGSGEGAFGIHDPVDLARGLEEASEGVSLGKRSMPTEEAELAGVMGLDEPFEEATPEQSGQDPHG